jgi:hypothetical protein
LALTLLTEEGVPLHVIKAFADHADIKVTERYLHARRGPMDEAARKLEQRYVREAARNVGPNRQVTDLIGQSAGLWIPYSEV